MENLHIGQENFYVGSVVCHELSSAQKAGASQ